MPWTLRMMLITFAAVLIPYTYIAWRLINALTLFYPHLNKSLKIVIPLIIIVLNLLPIISGIAYVFGQYRNLFFFSDHFSVYDALILIPYWIGLIIILEAFPYFLASDLFLLISRWFSAPIKTNLVKWVALTKIILFTFFVIFVSIRVYLDTTKISLSIYDIPVNNLPSEFEDLNLVLTGDIQVDKYSPEEKIENLKKKIEKLKPDILFFAGDLVTSGTFYIDQGIEVLCETKSKPGQNCLCW